MRGAGKGTRDRYGLVIEAKPRNKTILKGGRKEDEKRRVYFDKHTLKPDSFYRSHNTVDLAILSLMNSTYIHCKLIVKNLMVSFG